MNRISKWRLVFLFCLIGLMQTYAQNITKPKIACPNGFWVNSYNGVLFFTRVDAEMNNTVLPISLQFYYNSSFKDRNYGYGLGFSIGEEMRYTQSGDSVIIERGDGRSDAYVKDLNGYQAPAGVFDVLTQSGDGTFVLTMKGGTIYRFQDANTQRVTEIETRTGFKTTMRYNPEGQLTEVNDQAGRSLQLVYTNGLLSQATGSFIQGTISYQYDNQKRLTKVTDAMGYAISYGYDRENRLTSYTDAMGYVTKIGYTQQGAVYRVKTDVSEKVIRYEVANKRTVIIDYNEPASQFSYYVWDDKGRVIEKNGLCCGIQETLVYDDDDNIIRRTDANGNVRTFTYDGNGNMLTATDPEGHTESYTYEATYNQVTSYRDKRGNSYSYSYDSEGNLTTLSGPEGFTNRYTYNAMGAPVTITDANGNVSQNRYNDQGLLVEQTDAAGNRTTYTYDASGNLLSSTDPLQYTTLFAYNARNELVKVTNPLQHSIEFSYDRNGHVIRVKDAFNRITHNSFDALGNVLTATNAAGQVISYVYNQKSLPIRMVDPMGQTYQYSYDEHDRLIQEINPQGEATAYAYDTKGNLVSVVQSNGNTINYTYSKNDLLLDSYDATGLLIQQTYDANGNLLSETDGEGRTITYQYDALNRVISVTDPMDNREQYSYDPNSNRLSVTDRNGAKTSYVYDALNRITQITDALNRVTRFQYDGNGNLISAIDAKGNQTTYAYDALGQNTQITFANGTYMGYAYDAMGKVIRYQKRDGAKIHYSYDALYQLVETRYPDGSTDRFSYDALGQLISAVNAQATVTRSYDKVGRLLSETLNGQTTEYAYDIPNRRRLLVYPSGTQVVEHYDQRGLLSRIEEDGSLKVSQQYNRAGQLTQRAFSNGLTTNYTYNVNGWLSDISDGEVQDVTLTRDKIGNVLARLDQLKPERSEVYGYDQIGQLTAFHQGKANAGVVADPTRTISYRYDALGNRISEQVDGKTTNYTVNALNEYTRIQGEKSYSPNYDANGNLLEDEEHTYRYDYNNQLVQVDDNLATYQYDALGRRIRKQTAEATVCYFYAGNNVIEEQDANQLPVATYLIGNGIDDVVQMHRNGSDYFYHANHLGSVMAITDVDGDLQEQYAYNPFGQVTIINGDGVVQTQSAIGNSVLFTGRSYNAETKSYDYRARNMYPLLGRFMQVDPLLYVNGLNALSYVGNNPVRFVDPWGYKSSDCNSNSQPIIKAPTGPIMTSGDKPTDYKQPAPKSKFCIEHPYICGIQGEGHGEGCLVGGIGACADLGVAIDKDGVHLTAGVTPAVGVAATIGAGASSGFNLSGNSDGVNYTLRVNHSTKAGLVNGVEYTYDIQEQTHGLSGTVAGVTVKGSTDGSVAAGVDVGAGHGTFVGIRIGKTWTFKWW